MVQQAARVLRHRWSAVDGRVIELLAFAMPAIVIADHAPTGARERAHPAWVDPVGCDIGGKAVDEQDRLALPLVDISDRHAHWIEAFLSPPSLCLPRVYARRQFNETRPNITR